MNKRFLILAANEATAKKALARVKFNLVEDEVMEHQVIISHDGKKTYITCDESM